MIPLRCRDQLPGTAICESSQHQQGVWNPRTAEYGELATKSQLEGVSYDSRSPQFVCQSARVGSPAQGPVGRVGGVSSFLPMHLLRLPSRHRFLPAGDFGTTWLPAGNSSLGSCILLVRLLRRMPVQCLSIPNTLHQGCQLSLEAGR